MRDFTWEVLFVILVIIVIFRHRLQYPGATVQRRGSIIQAMLLLDLGSSKLAYALGLLLEVRYDKTSLRCRQEEYKLRWALVGTTTCCIVCASQYGHTYRMLVLSSGRHTPCRNYMYP